MLVSMINAMVKQIYSGQITQPDILASLGTPGYSIPLNLSKEVRNDFET